MGSKVKVIEKPFAEEAYQSTVCRRLRSSFAIVRALLGLGLGLGLSRG